MGKFLCLAETFFHESMDETNALFAFLKDQASPHLLVLPCTNAVSRIFWTSFISRKVFLAIFRVAFEPTMVVNHRTLESASASAQTALRFFVSAVVFGDGGAGAFRATTRRDSRIIRRTKLNSPPRQLFSFAVPPKFVRGF